MIKKFYKLILCITILWNFESMAGQDYLHIWKNLDDVTQFGEFITEHGIENLDNDTFKVVQTTVDNLKGKNDYLLICILTKAQYTISDPVMALASDIQTQLKNLVMSINIKFDGKDLNSLNFYSIKLAWLLFISQTIEYKGEEMIDGYEIYPISIAKELLEQQKNGLSELSSKIEKTIDKVIEG